MYNLLFIIMDILNFLYLKKQNLIKTVANDPSTDLLILGAEVPFTKKGDGYETYALSLLDAVPSVYNKANVTQITSETTGVTVNANTGVITTFALTTAAQAKTVFTVTNSVVTTDSLISVSLIYDEAAAGIPVVSVSDVANGSFKIIIANADATLALDDLAKIVFTIN